MVVRRSPRIDFQVRAKSASGNVSYNGYIDNFSREGMMKIIPDKKRLHIFPGTILNVRLETPSGETLDLGCEVKWLRHHLNMPFELSHHIGMEIKNPPQKYNEFIRDLYGEYLHESTTGA